MVFCAAVLLLNANAFSVQSKPTITHTPQILHIDSAKLQIRGFDQHAVRDYLKDKDFQYTSDATLDLSLWARFWRWVWWAIDHLFSSIFGGTGSWVFIRYALLIAAVGFLVYLVFRIIGVDVIQMFSGESKKVNIPYTESLENIHEISFDDEIESAIAKGNFRLAVRLLYLLSLKKLNDAQLINWQIDKTNSAYLNELTDDGQRNGFGILTRQFEYIWYGNFPVDSQSFQDINLLFQGFYKTLL